MAVYKPIYAASPVALTVTSLQSLGDGGYWQSASRSNVTDAAMMVRIFLTIVTTTGIGSSKGSISVYVAGSVDGGTDYGGGASGTEGAFTPVANSNQQLRLIDTMAINASETTSRTFKKEIVLGNVPKNYSIVLLNSTGAALSTGNIVEILIEQFDVA